MTIVKRIFRHLKVIEDYGLWYKKEGYFVIRFYTDVDQDGNIDDKKSTSGGSFFLGERFIKSMREIQSCNSQSTTNVKIIDIAID